MRGFTEKEISDALFQISPIKAPGPDGFPARFYLHNWDVMKAEVQHFFSPGVMPQGVNETRIVLIPKKQYPESMKSFLSV